MQFGDLIKELHRLFEDFGKMVDREYGIQVQKHQVDALLSLIRGGLDNEESPLANQDSTNDLDAEYDETLAEGLQELRIELRQMCRTIEESIPEDKMQFIERFDRPTALRKRSNKLSQVYDVRFKRRYKPYDASAKDERLSKVR